MSVNKVNEIIKKLGLKEEVFIEEIKLCTIEKLKDAGLALVDIKVFLEEGLFVFEAYLCEEKFLAFDSPLNVSYEILTDFEMLDLELKRMVCIEHIASYLLIEVDIRLDELFFEN